MDQDLGVLYDILDYELKKSKSGDELKEYVIVLERKYTKQKEFIRSLESNTHVGLAENELSNSFIPEDLPSSADKVYNAVKTTRNGDCLYNAVSLALVGNESYAAILLRLLVALELALNVDFCTNHPTFTYFPSSGRHPNTIFSLCLTGSSNKIFHDSDQNRVLAIWSEARTANKLKEWSGYFHVSELSTVLAKPVCSSYRNCQSWTRDIVHGIVYPRMVTFSADPVFLLFSQEGSDTKPGAWYEPNHFVPMYSVKAHGFYKSDETVKDEPTTGP